MLSSFRFRPIQALRFMGGFILRGVTRFDIWLTMVRCRLVEMLFRFNHNRQLLPVPVMLLCSQIPQ